jgi:hypothetical protein
MSTTPHPFAPEEIMAHLDGELPADRLESLARHLDDCLMCKEVMNSHRASRATMARWTVPEELTNSVFDGGLLDAARNAASKQRPLGAFRLGSYFRRHWLLTAVSSALAVGFVVLVSTTAFRPMSGFASWKLIEREATMHTDRDKSLGPVTDQQGKIFSNKLPVESLSSNLTTLATPGVTADSNGLFHGLGDHAQKSFSVDGQPISDQQSRVFSGPMISRTVSLSLFTKDLESSRASLDAILTRHNGYAAELNVATPLNSARSLQASLRIPAPQLPAVLAELKSLGRVEGETQNGEEVTQQHADLVARLKNSRETEQRLQAILTERTGKIKDVLEVEQEIARVRGGIEQMEAEQKNLEHRVDFATINLQLSEEYKAKLDSPAPAISTLIHNAAVNGYRNVADTLLSIILFFAEYGPVLIFWLLLLAIPATLVWRRWRHATAAI